MKQHPEVNIVEETKEPSDLFHPKINHTPNTSNSHSTILRKTGALIRLAKIRPATMPAAVAGKAARLFRQTSTV